MTTILNDDDDNDDDNNNDVDDSVDVSLNLTLKEYETQKTKYERFFIIDKSTIAVFSMTENDLVHIGNNSFKRNAISNGKDNVKPV